MLNLLYVLAAAVWRDVPNSRTLPQRAKARHFRFGGNGGPCWTSDSRRLQDFASPLEHAPPSRRFSKMAPGAATECARLAHCWDRLRWIPDLLVRERCRPGGYRQARSLFSGCSSIFAASVDLAIAGSQPAAHRFGGLRSEEHTSEL